MDMMTSRFFSDYKLGELELPLSALSDERCAPLT